MQSNNLTFQHSKSGFSILMAIGTIGVLLILVTSLAISYIRESRLSRYSYDEVIASTAAEGEFEYAMLKVRNHRDGFQDATFSGELDGNLLDLSTPRSSGLHTQYNIVASSTGTTFTLSGGQHLIVPLFADSGSFLVSSIGSKDPITSDVDNTTGLNISGISGLSWTITAMSGSESVAITGIGDITSATNGNIRIKAIQCYKYDGSLVTPVDNNCKPEDIHKDYNATNGSYTATGEELQYSYDIASTIGDFLLTKTDPYFILYNPDVAVRDIIFASSTPFALPTLTVRSTASKGESSQVFQFVEDKSRYYDALKYGVYNTTD